MLIKVASVLFIFLTLILSGIIVHFFKLQKGMAIYRYCLSFICLGVLPDFRQCLLPQPLTTISLEPFAFGLGANGLFLKKKKCFYYPKFIKYFWRWISSYLLALSDPNR